MNKSLIRRYLLICIPFIMGVVMYGCGIYNAISSVLLFSGGYIVVKNICDYRMIKKNIKRTTLDYNKKIDLKMNIDNKDNSYNKVINNDIENIFNQDMIDNKNFADEKIDSVSCKNGEINNDKKYGYRKDDNISGFKSTRRHIKIRRRY